MDLCFFDIKVFTPIIAALIASYTALHIANKWNGQKGSEVVAIEAKNILVKIIEIEKLNNSITNVLHHKKNETEKLVNKIIDFQSRTNELHSDFDIFKELIENEKHTSEAMNEYLSQSALSIVRYRALVESDNTEMNIHIVAIGLQKEFIGVGMNIKKKLRDYVLYKNRKF